MSNKAPSQQAIKAQQLQSTIDRVTAGQEAFCIHQTWGIGIIRSHDADNKSFTVDFPEQSKKGHVMDSAFFIAKIDFLNPDGLVARAYSESGRAAVAKTLAEEPAELVKALLAEYPTGECTSYALEASLERIHFASLAPGKDRSASFKTWWTKARAALRRDRAILIPERKGGLYALLEAPKDLGEDLFAQYESSPGLERRLELLGEMADSAAAETRSAATEANLAKVSADLAKAVAAASTPGRRRDGLPGALVGIWNRDKFFRSAIENVETFSPTASEVIALCDEQDLALLALNIPHTSEKIRALLDLVRAHHGEKWSERAFELLRSREVGAAKSGSAKLVSETVSYLCDAGLGAEVAGRFSQWLESRELRAPVIIWIVKNRGSRKYAEIVGPLVGPALLGAILSSIDSEALESNSSARIPLAFELVRDKELIDHLITPAGGKRADTETICDLARTLRDSQGFDDITRLKLISRIAKIEPLVQRLTQSRRGDDESGEKELIVSQSSKEEKERELADIVHNRLPAVKEAIQVAKEHGDLRENSEYKMARQDHDTLSARRAELETMLKKARVTDFSEAKPDVIGIGSTATLERGSDQQVVTYDILGAWDGRPEAGALSYISPLAKQFLNRRTGETFATNINGRTENWKVVSVARWVDRR
ncbi:MAG: GreA/GreB family elongation factor [Opitutales bacterium]